MTKLGLLLFLSLSSLASAQLQQPYRWEVEAKFTEETYSIVSLKKDGLALIRDLEKYGGGKKKWEIIILDTTLIETWKHEFELHNDLRFTGYEYVNGRLNLMFRRNETDILRSEIMWIDLSTHEIKTSSTEVKLQIRLTHYTVVDNCSVFGGYVTREPVLVIHDPDKNNNIIVPGFFLTDTELMDVRPNSNSTFNILLFQRTNTENKIIFRTIDKAGNILIEDEIPIDDDKKLISAATSVLQHDEVLIAGSYAYKNDKLASGIFSCLIDPFSEQPIRYTELYQLRHFLDFMPEKRAQRIKDKVSERSKANYNTNINIHRIEEYNGGFALFGESYVASTSSSTNLNSYPYGNQNRSFYNSPFASRYYNNPYLYPATPSVEEMRMQQSFVIGYDFKGRRVWDYSVPMDELKIPGRDQVSDFVVVDQVPAFLYKDDNDLKFSYHKQDTSKVGEPLTFPIRLMSESDVPKSKEEYEGNVRHWYTNYLYVWGVQSLKNKNRNDIEGSRRVFFINKIQFE